MCVGLQRGLLRRFAHLLRLLCAHCCPHIFYGPSVRPFQIQELDLICTFVQDPADVPGLLGGPHLTRLRLAFWKLASQGEVWLPAAAGLERVDLHLPEELFHSPGSRDYAASRDYPALAEQQAQAESAVAALALLPGLRTVGITWERVVVFEEEEEERGGECEMSTDDDDDFVDEGAAFAWQPAFATGLPTPLSESERQGREWLLGRLAAELPAVRVVLCGAARSRDAFSCMR